MSEQQYQGSDTALMIQYVKEGSWTVDQLVESREIEAASPEPDQDWITSIDEALTILRSQQ